MIVLVHKLLSLALFSVTGGCLFLLLLNRSLLLLADSKAKTPLILFSAVVLIGGGGYAGYHFAYQPWIFLPLLVLVALVLGEIREIFLRRRHRGSTPVDTRPHRVAITAPITTTDLMIHRYEVSLPQVTQRLRIVHITDMHADQRFPSDYYKNALATAESYKPDIAVFTGDFISHIKALPCMSDVVRPIAKYASYAVLGNHDYWVDPVGVAQRLRDCGLHVLTNESEALSIGTTQLAVTGYDYPWGTREEHIPSQPDGVLHLVLTHTPDNIYRLVNAKADLVFAGHYHAGQVRLPLRGSIVVPSIYGCRFDHGHFLIDKTHLFVASGIGASHPPVRIYCQPDIFVVDVFPLK